MPEPLVVDTNILFSFFRKGSATASIITGSHGGTLKLFAPELAVSELREYKPLICLKSDITAGEFELLLILAEYFVEFSPVDEYKEHFNNAISLASGFSEKDKAEFLEDADFFALALKLGSLIWSNDTLFKEQSRVEVLSTSELLSRLGLR